LRCQSWERNVTGGGGKSTACRGLRRQERRHAGPCLRASDAGARAAAAITRPQPVGKLRQRSASLPTQVRKLADILNCGFRIRSIRNVESRTRSACVHPQPPERSVLSARFPESTPGPQAGRQRKIDQRRTANDSQLSTRLHLQHRLGSSRTERVSRVRIGFRDTSTVAAAVPRRSGGAAIGSPEEERCGGGMRQ